MAQASAVPVSIRESVIGNLTVPSVNARELHRSIGSKRQFSNWITERIDKYGFAQGIDYISYSDNSRGCHITSREYMLSLDMAKELAMVENTGQGRVVRRYFIEMERRYLTERSVPAVLPGGASLPPMLDYARVTSMDLGRLEERIAHIKEKVPTPRRGVVARQVWNDLWQIAGGRRENRRLLPSERMPLYLTYLADRELHESEAKAKQTAKTSVGDIQRNAVDLPLPDAARKLGMSPEVLAKLLCEVHVLTKTGALEHHYSNGTLFRQAEGQPIVITRRGQIWLNELLASRKTGKTPQQQELALPAVA